MSSNKDTTWWICVFLFFLWGGLVLWSDTPTPHAPDSVAASPSIPKTNYEAQSRAPEVSTRITVSTMVISSNKMNQILGDYSSRCYSSSPGVVKFDDWLCIRQDGGSWNCEKLSF